MFKQVIFAAFLFVSLVACGNDDGGKRGKRGQPDWEEGVDPVEDIIEPPEEASSGDIWACTFYGVGDNGATFVEFEDNADFCFAESEDATDYVTEWRDACVEAFQTDGFYDYVCDAECDKTDEEC